MLYFSMFFLHIHPIREVNLLASTCYTCIPFMSSRNYGYEIYQPAMAQPTSFHLIMEVDLK